jgi:hypothetical protein
MAISIEFGAKNSSQKICFVTRNRHGEMENVYVRPEQIHDLMAFIRDIRNMSSGSYGATLQYIHDVGFEHGVFKHPFRMTLEEEEESK